MSDPSLDSDLQAWVALWERLHPQLARLVEDSGDPRASAALTQFAADLRQIAQLPQRLPVGRPPSPAPGAALEALQASREGARRARRNAAILLVDDGPDILIVLHRLVRAIAKGYPIMTAFDGREALAKLALHSIPLVITDYLMPGMNGLQLTQAIKEASPDTRVVMVTAYATPELEQKARAHGVDYYMPKPYQLDQLERIIHDVLASSPLA